MLVNILDDVDAFMQARSFLDNLPAGPETREVEASLRLYAYPKPDREPVKILVIGSKEAVSTIVYALHQLRFAETFEWTDFLAAPGPETPLRLQPGEVMKALVKHLPRP